MPIYEYRCQSCGKEMEFMQKITDEPIKTCPGCGGKLEKLISNTSFILKGTGWYATDYARKGSSEPSKASSDSKGDKDSESSSKKDTKD